jgi:hypothetical protein
MTQAELADLASLAPEEDPFNQPLVQQISSEEWEDLTRDPSPLVVEIFATWYVVCFLSILSLFFCSLFLAGRLKKHPSLLVLEISATWYVILVISILLFFRSLFLRLSLTQQFGSDECLTWYLAPWLWKLPRGMLYEVFVAMSKPSLLFSSLVVCELSSKQQFASEESEGRRRAPVPRL